MILDGEEYFTCVCSDYDHTLRFVLNLDRTSKIQIPTIYAETRMNHYLPWYKRLMIGIRYIFGTDIENQYSCWEINAESDSPEKMINMLTKLMDEIKFVNQKNVKLEIQPDIT